MMANPERFEKVMRPLLDLVRKYFPDAAESDLETILWQTTSFPAGEVEEIEAQLAAAGAAYQEEEQDAADSR